MKPSILSFPSHVTVLLVLIVAVVLAAIVAGFNNFSAACAAPLALAALVIPLRDLLNWVDDTRARYHTQPDGILQVEVNALAQELRLQPVLRIERTDQPIGIFTVGGLRRSLIVGNARLLDHFARCLASKDEGDATSVRVILHHELQHVAQRDLRRLGYGQRLLVTLLKWSAWTALMVIGGLLLLSLLGVPALETAAQPGFVNSVARGSEEMATMIQAALPTTQQLQTTLEGARKVNYGEWLFVALMTLLPFILASGLLWLSAWRRMAQAREFYADAATVQRFGQAAVAQALDDFAVWQIVQSKPAPRSLLERISAGLNAIHNALQLSFPFHPSRQTRVQSLTDPLIGLMRPATVGITIGIVSFLLYIVLSSGFILLDAGTWPAHAGSLIAFISISVMTMPLVAASTTPTGDANDATAWSTMRRCAFIALAIGMAWPLLNGLLALAALLLFPEALLRMLELAVGTLLRVARPFVDTSDINRLWLGVVSLLASVLVGSIAVFVGLWLDVRLKRAVWRRLHSPLEPALSPSKGAGGKEKALSRSGMAVTITIAAGIALVLFVVTAMSALAPQRLLGLLPALALIALVGGVVWLFIILRR